MCGRLDLGELDRVFPMDHTRRERLLRHLCKLSIWQLEAKHFFAGTGTQLYKLKPLSHPTRLSSHVKLSAENVFASHGREAYETSIMYMALR